jgi:hypothetical protein
MDAKNIDDILVAEMQNTVVPQPTVSVNAQVEKPEEIKVESLKELPTDKKIDKPVNDPVQPDDLPDAAESKDKAIDDKASDSPIDEYGNPIEKPKMYSEEEVNRLIRERLSRGRQQEQQAQQQVQQTQVQQQPVQQQEEDWESQLKTVIKKTLYETQEEIAQKQWQQQESSRQAEFQEKFQTGMNKYQDFHQVVSGKPISDSMMLATRNLENPAAFIYGAAKFHGQDLERISKISDPYAQASEIGRLHEKMIKSKNVVSSAPKPLEAVSGDMPHKISNQGSIDERIIQYAKQKRR